MIRCLILAQDQPSGSSGWFGLDDVFWLTILLVFVVAIVGALLRLRQKDKCLKLIDKYHVTYLTVDGRTMWGDLSVASQGLELQFDAPYRTRRGLAKNSLLIFQDELSNCLAICRTVYGLTEAERHDRERQIRRSFEPGLLRRLARWLRNIVNTVRDAFTKALGMAAGQVGRTSPVGGAIKSQRGGIDELGKTLVGAVGNAYEPILERYIGRPVVLELTNPAGSDSPVCELPGYLVDYTDRYVAVFNAQHEPVETLELEVTESLQRDGVKIDLLDDKVVVTCQGEDALVVRRVTFSGRTTDLSVTLIPGCSVRLIRAANEPVTLEIERTRQIDIVCPRSVARIRYGSQGPTVGRTGWSGTAPQMEAQESPDASDQ